MGRTRAELIIAVHLLRRVAILATVTLGLTGCSLVSIKTPEKPLSTRDLNARILTQEYASRFNIAVAQTADLISASTQDSLVRMNALRWKIAATSASQRAASQMAPMMSLLDAWALAVQMREYLTSGAGRSLFGAQQPRAVAQATQLAQEVDDVARHVIDSREYVHDQQFIEGYVQSHPIESLDFARASLVDLWAQENGGKTKLVDSLGTMPEAMAQAGALVRMYGDTAPSEVLWRAQLAAQESGISGKEVQTALQRLDERLARMSDLADSTPDLVNGVVRDVRKRVDASWSEMLTTLHTERTALGAEFSAQRQAALDAVDAERVAVVADATRIANQIISDAGKEARRLVREALILMIVLAIVVLGLPFVAGYLVGRAQRRA